ncbi:WBC30 [Acrasis kona]|uniref:WBC30 n=1 Tax=Acrasis kona TaxID=1008807 RepID=A0AAW2Z257_9EUKA
MGQYFLFTLRSLLQLVRHMKGLLFDFIFFAGVASIIGGLYFNLEFIGPVAASVQAQCPELVKSVCALPISDRIGVMSLLTVTGIAIPAMQSVLKTFGSDKHLYRRESDNGINKISYFLGKMTADAPGFVILSLLFLSFWYVLISPMANFGAYWGLLMLSMWVYTGLGYFVSMLVQRTHAELVGSLCILVSALLGGVNPTVSFMSHEWYTLVLVSLSPIRWLTEALYLLEIRVYQTQDVNVDSALAYYGYDMNDMYKCVLVALAWGFIFRLLSLFWLYFKDQRIRNRFLVWIRVYWRRSKKAVLKKKKTKDQDFELMDEHEDNPIVELDMQDSDDEDGQTVKDATNNAMLTESLLNEDEQEDVLDVQQ